MALVYPQITAHEFEQEHAVLLAHLLEDLPEPLLPVLSILIASVAIYCASGFKGFRGYFSLRASSTAGNLRCEMRKHSFTNTVLDS